MKKSPLAIPRTRAKTAWGLFKDLCKVIAEEPRRYDQRVTLLRKNDDEFHYKSSREFPSCRTIGCRAGWAVTLFYGVEKAQWIEERSGLKMTLWDEAARLLGLTESQANYLFNALAVDGPSQTKVHAEHGVRGLTRFMKNHAKQLKAHRLTKRRSWKA